MKIGQTLKFGELPGNCFFYYSIFLCYKFPYFFWKDVGVPHNIMNSDLGKTDFLDENQPVSFAGFIEDIRGY